MKKYQAYGVWALVLVAACSSSSNSNLRSEGGVGDGASDGGLLKSDVLPATDLSSMGDRPPASDRSSELPIFMDGGTDRPADASIESIQRDGGTVDVAVSDGARADLPLADARGAMDTSLPHGPEAGISLPDGTIGRTNTCVGPASLALANAQVPAGYCAWTYADALDAPRGATLTPDGDLLIVESRIGQVTLLYDDNGDGASGPGERVALASAPGLNHGIAVGGGFLYASSATTVFRWPYTGGRTPLVAPQTVVSLIPRQGHSTRTLVLDSQGRLYVSIGSGSNVDGDSSRSRILRFTQAQLAAGATFAQGEVFADGLRNEVGIAFDSRGRLWGVENGVDSLNRANLGGDIHNDNPGEELNLFAEPGRFYGYPYCFSEYLLPTGTGLGPGTQWVHPDFIGEGNYSDAWCRDTANVVPPVLVMPAHTAPLDITFYTGGSFPADTVGNALVSYHGSWNRQPPIGYKVVRIPFGADGMPSGPPEGLLESASPGDRPVDWPHRPVGLVVGPRGEVFVTSDASNQVIVIGHGGM